FFGGRKGEQLRPFIDGSEGPVICSKINIFEVYHKILRVKGKEDAERIASFMVQASFMDDLGNDTIKLAAEEKAKLGLGMADAIIVATAIKHGATLYTMDRDFEKAKGLLTIVFL
ncbi:MAG: PIN domain-containing protein, partial [Candidatus Aenigmarchaeota archaeon]|nr:PIN domain-containing protein [Candidatus Aenigmarchaeota archaeon]